MRHAILIVSALLLCNLAQAQFFALGLKGGVNTQINKPDDILVSGDTSFNLGVKDFKFGTQFGAFIRIGNKMFFQPELIFNSNRTDFQVGTSSVGEVVKTERYQFLDLPLMVGVKTGPIRINAGPVGHYFLNNNSELKDVKGYSDKFKQMTWGWQAGITIGTGRFSADLRYEGNFSKSGDHINFFGKPYHFSNNPARFILGVNIALIK